MKEEIPHSAPWVTEADRKAVEECLASDQIAKGEKVKEFEALFAKTTGIPFVRSVDSGTSGIYLALKALGVDDGDEVLMPTYICASVQDAVLKAGGIPVLCDNGRYWGLSLDSVREKRGPKSKALIIAHMFGIEEDPEPFKELGLPILEDCCQAFGRKENGEWIGKKGDLSIFSFHATKCLTTGEGGMVASHNEEVIDRVSAYQGKEGRLMILSDLQASLGLSQLGRYEDFLSRRKRIAERYLKELPDRMTQKVQEVSDRSMFFRFPLSFDHDHGSLRKVLEDKGIHVRKGVDDLIHFNEDVGSAEVPNSMERYHNTLSIPILPQMADEDVSKIIDEIRDL